MNISPSSKLTNAIAGLALIATAVAAHGQSSHLVTQGTIDGWKRTLNNWGRWGADDQKGTLNLITPTVRRKAAALVKQGVSVSLERDIVPQIIDPAGRMPVDASTLQQRMLTAPPETPTGSSDLLSIAAHGYTVTHMDALGHHLFDGQMYNGFEGRVYLSMEKGLTRGSIAAVAQGVFTRGVLVDIPRLRGVPYLEPGTPIYVEDIEAWERFAGVRIGPGDAVFIRTGRWERESAKGPWNIEKNAAGLDASVIPWLRKRDIAILGSESALSVVPFPVTTKISNRDDHLPVHNFSLVAIGMPLIDDADLSELSKVSKRLKRYTFLLTVAPIRVTTGTGVPVNPVATF